MPPTAKFKETLRAYAKQTTKSRQVDRDHATKERGPKMSAEQVATSHTQESFPGSPGACPGERSLHGLPNRGLLLDLEATALIIFPGITKRGLQGKMKWVREHVPFKVSLGHRTVGWFEADVRWWLEDRRNGIVQSFPTARAKGSVRGRRVAKTTGSAHARKSRRAPGRSRREKSRAVR